MSEKMMDGKVVVVTGAGRGIGREIALLMARHGAKVVVNDVGVSVTGETGSEDPAEEVVAAIRHAGGEAIANRDSVAEWNSANQLVTADILAWCRESMAAYKAPRIVEIVDSLPKSATGKLAWRELQEKERAASTAQPVTGGDRPKDAA